MSEKSNLFAFFFEREHVLPTLVRQETKTSVFSLFCAHLIVPLATPKVLSFDKKAKTFVFSLFCAHLSVPLHSQLVLPHIMIGWCGDGAKMGMG